MTGTTRLQSSRGRELRAKKGLPTTYDSLRPLERRAVREQYTELQRGLCYWCSAPLSGPPAEDQRQKQIKRELFPHSFFDYPVHLQHCRKTGMTEGAVHAHCNAIMWQYYGR